MALSVVNPFGGLESFFQTLVDHTQNDEYRYLISLLILDNCPFSRDISKLIASFLTRESPWLLTFGVHKRDPIQGLNFVPREPPLLFHCQDDAHAHLRTRLYNYCVQKQEWLCKIDDFCESFPLNGLGDWDWLKRAFDDIDFATTCAQAVACAGNEAEMFAFQLTQVQYQSPDVHLDSATGQTSLASKPTVSTQDRDNEAFARKKQQWKRALVKCIKRFHWQLDPTAYD